MFLVSFIFSTKITHFTPYASIELPDSFISRMSVTEVQFTLRDSYYCTHLDSL